MINDAYLHQYYVDGIPKQLNISVIGKDISITNAEMHNTNFELTERLMSENQLKFGTCEASTLKYRISNIYEPLINQEILVSERLKGLKDDFVYGKYKIFSDAPTSDRQYRDIVAYDDMHRIINEDVANWYNSVFVSDDVVVTLKELRQSFCLHFGLEEEDITLCNDDMSVSKTIFPSEISGKDVLSCIGEINGCFPHISRSGKMQYIVLKNASKAVYPENTLFPSNTVYPGEGGIVDLSEPTYRIVKSVYPADTVFPEESLKPLNNVEKRTGSTIYKKCSYEDYTSNKITRVLIRKEEGDAGADAGVTGNTYIVQDNFLVYGKSQEELQAIAENLLNAIKHIEYIPYNCDTKGNPCIEVGDAIEIDARGKKVKSYVFERTLKGVQDLSDSVSARGKKEQIEKLNSTQRSIIELKGKANILTRTVDETRSYIYDTEQRLSSEILQQAGEIALRVRKDQIISEINLTPEQITISANKIDLIGIVNSDTFIANLVNAEQLNAKFATVENLIAVNANFSNLNASNLKVGTVNTARLDIDGIIAGFASKTIQAINFTAQTIRGSNYEIFDGEYQRYVNLNLVTVNIGGENYRVLGYKV